MPESAVTDLGAYRKARFEAWLAELNRLLLETYAIRHTDLGWSPADTAREHSTGASPAEIVARIGARHGLFRA
jgi:hypothetical protein